MKYFLKYISLIFLCSMHSLTTKQGAVANIAQPPAAQNIPAVSQPQIQPQLKPQQQVVQHQVVIQKPTTYAQALTTIKTLPSAMVIINNTINPNFIALVKSFNFTDIETKALIEAGANIHTSWTANEQMNKQINTSLKNTIKSATPIQPSPVKVPDKVLAKPEATKDKARPPRKPAPTKPTPIKPAEQKKPTAGKGTPAKPLAKPIAQPAPTQNYAITNNLVMALDPRRKETVETAAEAVFQQAIIALYYKSSAVIMTNNIFEIMMRVRQQIGDANLQKLRTIGFQQLFPLAQQLASQVSIRGISAISIILLSFIIFDTNNINCYFHTSENIVLLIPKEYIRTNIPKSLNTSALDQARACGFNPQVLRSVTDLNAENLLKQLTIEKTRPTIQDECVPHLIEMFIPQKKNGQLLFPTHDSKWLIYIVGHGGPSYMNIGTARQQYTMIKQSIDNAKHNLAMGQKISADMRNKSQAYLKEYEPRLKEYENMLAGKDSWQNSQMIPESSQIAGIMAPDFAKLMTFFNDTIDTAYVHYVTCFAGGSNQTFVNQTLSSLNVKYIVSTQGIHEGYTSAQIGMSWDSRSGMKVTGQDFGEFFRLLRMFFTQQEEFVKIKNTGQDPIKMIIATMSSDEKAQNQPFVRFPGAGFFEAIPVTKQTKTITKTMVKAHEIENKPFDFSDPNINVLIINTPRINVPIDFGKKGAQGHTALVTPSPATFTPGYEGLLLIKEVNWQDTLQSLLFNLSYLNTRMFSQSFVIKRLNGILLQQSGISGNQGASIKNFIVHTQGIPGRGFGSGQAMQRNPVTPDTVNNGQVGTNIHAAFELDGTIYHCFFAIKDIEATDELRNGIEQLRFTATPAQSLNMNTFAQNFLTQQEIAHVAKPITLESIATFVDDKIDKQDPSMAIWSDADQDALLKMVKERVKK